MAASVLVFLLEVAPPEDGIARREPAPAGPGGGVPPSGFGGAQPGTGTLRGDRDYRREDRR